MSPSDDDSTGIIAAFLQPHFGHLSGKPSLSNEELKVIDSIIKYVGDRFGGMKYILGLALDFTILAQRLSLIDENSRSFNPAMSEDDLFSRYALVEKRGKRGANTLTLTYSGQSVGIRQTEEQVVQLFHQLDRSDYPSAYVYITGQWQKYRDLLLLCFRLSEAGRLQVCEKLIHLGMDLLPKNQFFGRPVARPLLFETIIRNYARSAVNENGGLAYQAIAYGYVSADRMHLDIIADKVRTGSARQKRFGDIDCYNGLDLEISFEVKDIAINGDNMQRELGGFISEVSRHRIRGVAFVLSVEEEQRQTLATAGIVCISQADLSLLVQTWDWVKQNMAVGGMLHYLAHIEQNTHAVARLIAFIRSVDPEHDCLVYTPPAANGKSD